MSKPEEDLKAILDLLAEWRRDNGLKSVYASIYPDGFACAYGDNDNESEDFLHFVSGRYGRTEIQGGDLDGKEQSS